MMDLKSIKERAKTVINKIYTNTIKYYIQRLFGQPVSILFLGIDYAGKTTLLNKLRSDVVGNYTPTQNSNQIEVDIGKMRVKVIDLGGHKLARLAWGDYFFSCDGIVFIVDVEDQKRFGDVKNAFQILQENEHKKVPIAVLFNKIDKLGYDSDSAENDVRFVEHVCQETGISNNCGEGSPVMINFVSILKESTANANSPLLRSFQWLEKMVSLRKQTGPVSKKEF